MSSLEQPEDSQLQSVAQSALRVVGALLGAPPAADNSTDPTEPRLQVDGAVQSVVAAILKSMEEGEAPVVVQGGGMEIAAQRWVTPAVGAVAAARFPLAFACCQ